MGAGAGNPSLPLPLGGIARALGRENEIGKAKIDIYLCGTTQCRRGRFGS